MLITLVYINHILMNQESLEHKELTTCALEIQEVAWHEDYVG